MAAPHHFLRTRLTSAAAAEEGLTATELIADLPLTEPLAALPAGPTPDTLATWWALEPAAVLEGEAVLNRFYKEPDQRRWYHGSDDLSAWIWVRDAQDAGAVVIAVAVQDDRIVTGTPEEGDSVHLQLRPAGGPTHEATWSLGAPMADDAVFSKGQVQRATRPQGGSWLLYTGQVAAERLGTAPFELAIEVRDNDGFGLKQTAAFTLTSRRR